MSGNKSLIAIKQALNNGKDTHNKCSYLITGTVSTLIDVLSSSTSIEEQFIWGVVLLCYNGTGNNVYLQWIQKGDKGYYKSVSIPTTGNANMPHKRNHFFELKRILNNCKKDKKYSQHTHVVCIAYTDKEGNFSDFQLGGTGKIKKNDIYIEDPLYSVIREIKEETGLLLDSKLIQFVYKENNNNIYIVSI
jgi:hypothetical protein